MGIHVQYSVSICKSEILFVAHIQGCYNFLGLSCLALFECSYIGHLQFCTNKIKDAIANENKEQYQKGK